jgi:transcriptional regulator GlxA family with amidase domain
VAHVRGRWDADGLVPVSRAELAAAADVSVAHLARLFRAEFGCGPSRGLELVRLARALVLLRGGSMTVREVGAAVGFADQYHFSHRFRASFGTSPSAYRAASAAERRTVAVPREVERLAQLLAQDTGPAASG